MIDSNSILLFVTDAPKSAKFYARLLGLDPVESSPTFAMFILPSGLALGLWGKAPVEPAPAAAGDSTWRRTEPCPAAGSLLHQQTMSVSAALPGSCKSVTARPLRSSGARQATA
ncbi:VOC family protein [Rhizobium aegyptiacum]|uniref:VOC family protein n=1 Tax=Rhizobium aegyptiacum TaxID=1764550 RepID=UPI001FD99BD2|nr:VOC family protein [Rhizobium aegyptiacum]